MGNTGASTPQPRRQPGASRPLLSIRASQTSIQETSIGRSRGNFITISRTETGDYKPDRHPIWLDSDHVPVIGFVERFPSLDEALEWVRQTVDEETRLRDGYHRGLRELRDTLESTPC